MCFATKLHIFKVLKLLFETTIPSIAAWASLRHACSLSSTWSCPVSTHIFSQIRILNRAFCTPTVKDIFLQQKILNFATEVKCNDSGQK